MAQSHKSAIKKSINVKMKIRESLPFDLSFLPSEHVNKDLCKYQSFHLSTRTRAIASPPAPPPATALVLKICGNALDQPAGGKSTCNENAEIQLCRASSQAAGARITILKLFVKNSCPWTSNFHPSPPPHPPPGGIWTLSRVTRPGLPGACNWRIPNSVLRKENFWILLSKLPNTLKD